MQQQINLYLLLPKSTSRKLTADVILIAWAALLLILIFNYVYLLAQKNNLLDTLQDLNVQLINEKKHLTETLEKYPLINPDDLEGSLGRLQSNLTSKSKLMQALASPAKFSDYLTALAATDISGEWLTQIKVLQSGLILELYGEARTQEKVHDYYQQLKTIPFFSKMDFSVTDVSQAKQEGTVPTAVSFTITGSTTSLYE